MVIGLGNVGRRHESTFRTEAGYPFPGILLPVPERSVPSYDFSENRQILRVRFDCPVDTGAIVLDPAGRRFLLADNDTGAIGDRVLYRSHRAFPLNHQAEWAREATILDPLTRLPKGTGKQALGPVWVLREVHGRERADNYFKVAEEMHRIITAAPVLLNDLLDGVKIKRVNRVLGVWLVETQ